MQEKFAAEITHIHYFMKSLIAINVAIIVSGGFLTPLWDDFVRMIGGNVATAGVAISVFSIALGVCMWFAARLVHYWRNEELMMLLTAILMSLCYLGYFFVHHPWELYLIQAALGLSAAFQCPAIYSLYARYMPRSRTAFHWGIWNAFYNVSVGIAALISALIAKFWGFYAVFGTLFVVSIIALVLTIIIMPKVKRFSYE